MGVENYKRKGDYSDHQKHLELMHKSRVNSNNTKYLNHMDRAQKVLDAHYTRQASKQFRHKALLNQKKFNWQLKYDRIRGELRHKTIPNTTREMLVKREQELQKS